MSWICPYCGTENYREPLNSRYTPECTSCGKDYITPDELEAQIKPQIEETRKIIEAGRRRLQEVRGDIASLNDEIAGFEIKKNDIMKDIVADEDELKKLETFVIFREVDKEAKARLDVHQKTLPFEVLV